ncbi:hypothetical protein [Hydrogenophilus thermoluteolus]|uniref:Uncharacterized protein n=1 Tax=Hydrogenophilus thermoluteolus TaxID=297 RepID=A0A2Z6DYE9_HYDTE|nr:hypothetical protein [Hydrogenophilus thermoluteolus]BBD77410.1 hypothetical protein HPTL_1146 [Hydrogenophilus thermoluteolus]
MANPIESLIDELDEHFEERAAILQFEGGLPAGEAERRALRETVEWARGRGCPAAVLSAWRNENQAA